MADERPEHPEHPESDAIGRVSHYYSQLSVAAVSLDAPLRVGDRIHIKGHTTDLVQAVDSLQVDHKPVERAVPGDDVALKVDDHVREHDKIYLEG
jgi:translation elongation factor EF-1alpha